VVGGGAAGLFAAIAAAEGGCSVVLLERNAKAGVKILASGGGRCNLTTTRSGSDLLKSYPNHQQRFLKSALKALNPSKLRDWFESRGVPTVIEDWEKVFPVAGRARVVLDALLKEVVRLNVEVRAASRVRSILPLPEDRLSVVTESGSLLAHSVILAAGGESYPKAGTTGDGVSLCEALGHRSTRRVPALVGLTLQFPASELAGITIDKVVMHSRPRGRRVSTTDRPLLFTHIGLSGPGPMNLSGDFASEGGGILEVDFAPKWTFAELDAAFIDVAKEHPNQSLLESIPPQLPLRLKEWLLKRAEAPASVPMQALKREHRRALVSTLKACEFSVSGTQGFDRAEVTRGGIELSEVCPRTMKSRLCKGVFLCGELLDIDCPIGGFNFQAAFATGLLAGLGAAALKPLRLTESTRSSSESPGVP
jgi:predicted Rossmann fold flavoprotein